MKKESMQEVEDFYINLGYSGSKLREALSVDKNYQKLLEEKKKKLNNQIKVSPMEKKKYVLATDVDFEILDKCKKLEKLKLSQEDKVLVALAKAQLEEDWRKSLVKKLNQLLARYEKRD
ncbi:MAG: hypothetical protein V1819_00745 [bacterium]